MDDTHRYHRVVRSLSTTRVLDIVATRSAQESYRWGRSEVRAGARLYGEPVVVYLYASLDDLNNENPYHEIRGGAR